MEDTGRIRQYLSPAARRILFGITADDGINAEIEHLSEIDRAHLVMLAETGIVNTSCVRRLLAEINRLRECGFAPLRGRAAPRGLYLLYEDYLIERLGPATGGALQTARSRNDLNATALQLRLRKPYRQLFRESLRLQAVLVRRAGAYAETVMPAYTHYQPAAPISYGHYLAAVAQALGRDLRALSEAGRYLACSPLGAGSVAGATLPINTERTAFLLGFDAPSLNSIDAVASRDLVLRLLSAAAIMGVTISRLATDLLLWSTSEFGFISLPDSLVGSSSIMPQKRNPFILEHVLGRCAAPVGAFVSAATAMHGAPFTNSVAVGTEAVSHVWKALQSVTEAITLARLSVNGAKPEPRRMIQRAAAGYTTATELANRLMTHCGLSFRTTHHMVGALVRDAVESGLLLQDAARLKLSDPPPSTSLEHLDPGSVAGASRFGGGPAIDSLTVCLNRLRAEWNEQARGFRQLSQKWETAKQELGATVAQMLNSYT